MQITSAPTKKPPTTPKPLPQKSAMTLVTLPSLHNPAKPTKPLYEFPVRNRNPFSSQGNPYKPHRGKPLIRKSYRSRKDRKPLQPDPYSHLPVNLRPIFPGGGSRFDDWEREKTKRRKLAELKAAQKAAKKAKHGAKGYRSSAQYFRPSIYTFLTCIYIFWIYSVHTNILITF